MTRFIARVMMTTFSLAGAGGAFGQVVPAAPSPQAPAASPQVQAPILQDTGDSRQTRQRLNEILRQYPPAVGGVLTLDPSLLSRPDYLAPYPALGAFLAQHPEIIRNPSFFFGEVFDREPPDARSRTINMFENVLGGAALFTAAMALLGMLAWLIRQILEHRKWLRASKVQTDLHTKLLDRLTSNEDLLAYIQTPAGRRFLEAAPSPIDAEPRPMGAPVGRILWSVHAGIVLVSLGIVEHADSADATPRHPDVADRATARIDLARAMHRLSRRERSLLWLAYAQGWSHEEIAFALGLKTASMKTLLFRARRHLVGLLTGSRGGRT